MLKAHKNISRLNKTVNLDCKLKFSKQLVFKLKCVSLKIREHDKSKIMSKVAKKTLANLSTAIGAGCFLAFLVAKWLRLEL